jgi:hypothetical protein
MPLAPAQTALPTRAMSSPTVAVDSLCQQRSADCELSADRRTVGTRLEDSNGCTVAPSPIGRAGAPSVVTRDTRTIPFVFCCDLCARLQAAGDSPITCRDFLHRCAWSVKPKRCAISLRDASVCSMHRAANSTRRQMTSACGGSPNVRLNEREKCASLIWMSVHTSETEIAFRQRTNSPLPPHCVASKIRYYCTRARGRETQRSFPELMLQLGVQISLAS